MKIGDRIKMARKNKGLTQMQLASLINVSKQVMSNWERGYTPSISNEYIALLATALDVSPDYLLGRCSNPELEFKIEINEDAAIYNVSDVDRILNDARNALAMAVKDGHITEEQAIGAVDLAKKQLMFFLDSKK